jgi:glycolate oxidase
MRELDLALLEMARSLPTDAIVRDRDVCEGYAHDESEAPPCIPVAVIRANSTAEVSAVLRAANAHDVPVTPRAGGTGRVGGAVPCEGGIVLVMERLARLSGIEREDMIAVVEPGLVTGALHAAVEAEGLFYPPDPNSLASCCLGGNVAANAGGPRAFKYGVTGDYVRALEVVLADGRVLSLGRRTKKGVTGYDLTGLMVGSEGTLSVITEITVGLVPLPESVATLLVLLPDESNVGASVTRILRERLVPRCVELLDRIALELVRPAIGIALPEGARALLLVELDGPAHALSRDVERIGNALLDEGALEVLVAEKSGERERLWAARRELSRTLRTKARQKLSEDIVVPRTRIADLLAHTRMLSAKHGLLMPTYGHAGDGNLHVNFLWNDDSERPAVDAAIESLFVETIRLGGTLSGEHGIGLLKAPYLHLEQSDALIDTQLALKRTLDPNGILNPGKIFGRRGHTAC